MVEMTKNGRNDRKSESFEALEYSISNYEYRIEEIILFPIKIHNLIFFIKSLLSKTRF